MTIRRAIHPLGGEKEPYKREQILFNGNNGATSAVTFKKGVYFVRGQGGGGGGGNNVYWGNGGGGGGSAGFEGYLYFTEDMNVQVGAAIGAGTGANGADTYINNVMVLGGGKAGGSDNNQPGVGGIFQFDHVIATKGKVKIISYTKKSNGNPGGRNAANPNADRGGADSILTNNGGGIMGGNRTQRNAAQWGAGGAGGHQWDQAGGNGSCGDILIKYVRLRP